MFKKTAVLAATVSAMAVGAAHAEVKMAWIDPLSGPFGPSGEAAYTSFLLEAEKINAAGGVNGEMVEILGYDNKINPKESLVQLQKAIDDGARYVFQGNGSSVAAALIEAGAIDGLSIGYRTVKASKNDKGQRLLNELELWEVSLVTFPMLPSARVAAKGDTPQAVDALRELAAVLKGARLSSARD